MYYNHTKHWQPYDVHISRRLHYRFQHFLIYHTIWSRHHDVAVPHHNPVQPCTASVPAVEADYSTRCTCYNICHNCQCNDSSNPHGTNPSKKQETYPHQTLSASENPYHWQRRVHVQCYMVRFRIIVLSEFCAHDGDKASTKLQNDIVYFVNPTFCTNLLPQNVV